MLYASRISLIIIFIRAVILLPPQQALIFSIPKGLSHPPLLAANQRLFLIARPTSFCGKDYSNSFPKLNIQACKFEAPKCSAGSKLQKTYFIHVNIMFVIPDFLCVSLPVLKYL